MDSDLAQIEFISKFPKKVVEMIFGIEFSKDEEYSINIGITIFMLNLSVSISRFCYALNSIGAY